MNKGLAAVGLSALLVIVYIIFEWRAAAVRKARGNS